MVSPLAYIHPEAKIGENVEIAPFVFIDKNVVIGDNNKIMANVIEREGDRLTHLIFDELGTTFITPFDREDIHDLASCMDDVIDGINSCAKRISIYNPRPISENGKELSRLIQEEAIYICKAMDELETFRKKPTLLREYCSKLHEIENQADDVYEFFITKLFEEEKDCIELIKIKEIMHELEKTTDAAEHVGKILKNLIVKYA